MGKVCSLQGPDALAMLCSHRPGLLHTECIECTPLGASDVLEHVMDSSTAATVAVLLSLIAHMHCCHGAAGGRLVLPPTSEHGAAVSQGLLDSARMLQRWAPAKEAVATAACSSCIWHGTVRIKDLYLPGRGCNQVLQHY
jgi:hypothetical protein